MRYYLVYACIFLVSYGYSQSPLQSSMEPAIESAHYDRLLALVRKFDKTDPTIEERQDLFESLVKRASVCSSQRVFDYEKARDKDNYIALFGLGLCCIGAYRMFTADHENKFWRQYTILNTLSREERKARYDKNMGIGSLYILIGGLFIVSLCKYSAENYLLSQEQKFHMKMHQIREYLKVEYLKYGTHDKYVSISSGR